MPLLDFLKDENNFLIGPSIDSLGNVILDGSGAPIIRPNTNLNYGGPSKGIIYGQRSGETSKPNYHLDRVEWYGSDNDTSGTKPTFTNGGIDHKSSNVDYIFRGGSSAFFDRRTQDTLRISNFLYNSEKGGQFLLRQGALQLLNPQSNTRTFNAGVSMLASVAAAGVTSIKRSGLLPEPVDVNFGSDLGGSPIGNFTNNVLGGGYLNLKGITSRETKDGYGLGSPGKPTLKKGLAKVIDVTFGGNPFAKKESYNVSLQDSIDSNQIDLINYQKIFKAQGAPPLEINGEKIYSKDLVNFRFEVVDSDNPINSNYIIFRAFLDTLGDNFNATHNEIKYNGRGEQFYTYNSFKRDINLGFKIAAQSRHEMKPLYQKLNYLAAQTAPNYSPSMGRIRTPYMKLTVGDYFNRIPGVLNNVNIAWQTNYPWEIAYDPEEKDKDMLVLPHVLDITLTFTPIHSFTPNNSATKSPYIGISSWLNDETVLEETPPPTTT